MDKAEQLFLKYASYKYKIRYVTPSSDNWRPTSSSTFEWDDSYYGKKPPSNLLPFAENGAGDYILSDSKKGRLYEFNHETAKKEKPFTKTRIISVLPDNKAGSTNKVRFITKNSDNWSPIVDTNFKDPSIKKHIFIGSNGFGDYLLNDKVTGRLFEYLHERGNKVKPTKIEKVILN